MNKTDPIFTIGEKNASFPVEGNTDCQGYLIDTDSKIGLVVISEWWGLNKSICITADKLAKLGYKIVVPDFYRGKVATDREHAGHLMQGLDFPGAVKDIIASIKFLKQKRCEHVAVTGMCMGGALSLATASSSTEVELVIPFYGIPDQKYFPVENIKCPVLFQSGDQDALMGFSDPEYVNSIKEKALKAGVKFESILYKNANHAFMNQDSENYNQNVTEEATQKLDEFIKKHFK